MNPPVHKIGHDNPEKLSVDAFLCFSSKFCKNSEPGSQDCESTRPTSARDVNNVNLALAEALLECRRQRNKLSFFGHNFEY